MKNLFKKIPGKSVQSVLRYAADKEDLKEYKFEIKSYALIFASKQPHDYTQMGSQETPQSIYEKGEAFSVKGDNFSWLHIGVLFNYGDKEAVYSRSLNADGTYDSQGVPQLKGIELDPVGVKNLESQLKIFSGSMVKLPPAGNPILVEAPSEGINRLAFNAELIGQILKGQFSAGLKKVNNIDFTDKYDSFSYRLNYKGKLFSVYRQPVQGYQGTPESIKKTNQGEEKGTFEPVDEQNKKEKENKKEASMEEESAENGGFDILQELVKRQHKIMPIRKAMEMEADIVKTSPATPNSPSGESMDYTTLKKQEKKLQDKSKLVKQMADTVKKIDDQKSASEILVTPHSVIGRFLGKDS